MITTNTGAKKIEGTDNWRGIFDAHNDSVDAHDQAIAKVEDGIAYRLGNTNTTGATLAVGAYVYVTGNTNGVADGMYKVSTAIAANASLTTSNLTAVPGGVANALNNKIKPYTGKYKGFWHYNGKTESGLFVPFDNADLYTGTVSATAGIDMPGFTTGLSVNAISKWKNGFLCKHTFSDTTQPASYMGAAGEITLTFS